jgi:inosine/xanthosine triphosphate pyrophosphatase family protein
MNKNLLQTLIFVSSRQWKFDQFQILTEKKLNEFFDISYKYHEIDEIQGNCEEVAIDKVIKAYKYFLQPVIVDDESLVCEGLNGFPGPYLKDFEKALLAQGVYDIVSKSKSNIVYPQVYYAFTHDGINVFTFQGKMKCEIIQPRIGMEMKCDCWEVFKLTALNVRLSELTPEMENSADNMRKIALEKLIIFLTDYAIKNKSCLI